MQETETGNFAISRSILYPPSSIKIVNWDINRGLQLPGSSSFLAPAKADIILLQETDLSARRTHRFNIARDISTRLSARSLVQLRVKRRHRK